MKKLVAALQVVLLGTFFPVPGLAVNVEWSLDGLTRADGGTVSGSFTYDADTNTYSAINVTTTQGSSTLPGETYAGFDPASSDAGGLILQRAQGASDLTGQNNIFLQFVPALSNSGGTLTPALASEVGCVNSNCSTATNSQSLTGDIVGTVVTSPPLPPADATPIPTMPTWLIAMMALFIAALAAPKLRRSTTRHN